MQDRSERVYLNGYRICSVEGCTNKHTARNLCRKHYNQQPDVKAKLEAYQQEYTAKEENKEKAREYHAKYRAEHKEQMAANTKRWRDKQAKKDAEDV